MLDEKTTEQPMDCNGKLLSVGDRVHDRWGYDLIVCVDDCGYYGQLVCDDDHSCKNIPYSLNRDDITKIE